MRHIILVLVAALFAISSFAEDKPATGFTDGTDSNRTGTKVITGQEEHQSGATSGTDAKTPPRHRNYSRAKSSTRKAKKATKKTTETTTTTTTKTE